MAVNVNEQDLDLLIIQEVQKNPILWNTRLNEYKNTRAKEVRFLVIAEKLGLNAQDVETRWKNLRKLYVRKRKDSLGKSGATSSWPYFRYLNFLAPIVRHRNTPRKRPIVIKCSQMSQEDTDGEEDKELYGEEDKELNEEEPSEAEQASSFVHSQNLQLMCPLKNREEKSDRIMCNFLKNSEKDVVANGEEDTHNLDFFKSLLPLIRGWTNVAKIEFRTDVLGLIKSTPRKRPIVIKCSQMSQEDTDGEEDKELYEEEDKELNEEEPSEAEQASSFVHSQNLQLMCPLKNREEKSDRIMCNFLKNSEKDVVANGEEDTHNLDFFKSLLPLIRGWTNVAKIEFRTDVLGLIKRYNETQNC